MMLYFTCNCRSYAILILLFFGISNLSHAEGTKQLAPASTDLVQLLTNASAYYNFARYDGTDSERLYIHIADPSNEIVYLGFSRPREEVLADAPFLDAYFRIKSPDGTVVYGPTLLNAASANLNSWQDASDGPSPLAASGGYTPFIFNPTGLAAGDYYIEFNVDATIPNVAAMIFDYWDITVANTSATPVTVDGRVFAKNWGFSCPPIDPLHPTYGNFNRPFNGAFYVYTDDQYVSKVDFNGAGFQPWAFNISLNQKGTSLTNDPAINRQSLALGQGNNPEYPIYLNDPDISVYPTGSFGELLLDSTEILGCPLTGFNIKVVTTSTGIVDLLLDFDQSTEVGVYNEGTADVLLPLYIQQQLSDTIPNSYSRFIPWDGLDGLGSTVNTVTAVPLKISYSQGEYHLPIYDAEFCLSGINSSVVRPTPPISYVLNHYFDDQQITGGTSEFEGCGPPCHGWTDFAFGNANTINTWWYAKQEFQSGDFDVNTDCGPDSDGDGIADIIDEDWDNDGLSNRLEACGKPGPSELIITIQLDNYPEETSWELRNSSNALLLSGDNYTVDYDLIVESYSADDLSGLTFTIFDSYDDGLFGIGYFQIVAGTHIYGGSGNGNFGTQASLATDSDIIYSCFGGADPTADDDFDSKPNYQDADFCDLNSFGVCSSLDLDNDGIPSFLDLDVDNDGIPDVVEAGFTDLNNDGQIDYGTPGDPMTMADDDNDGLADAGDSDSGGINAYPDTDGDNVVDIWDLDSDGDGLADLVEVGGTDSDGNGIVDEFGNPMDPDIDDNGWVDVYASNPLVNQSLNDPTINVDNDLFPNHLDIDSDNDGITDVIESGNLDGNFDGMADDGTVAGTFVDDNNDGWDDAHDGGITSTVADGPNDLNTAPDFSNGAGNDDFDNDGIPNWNDIDADNDGIVDSVEGVCSVGCPDQNGLLVDANANGLWDIYENLTDANGSGGTNIGVNPNLDDDDLGDSEPDYLDLNADDDIGYDWVEGFDANMNGDATDDLMGFATTYNTNSGAVPVPFDNDDDSDGDGIPDWMDNLNGAGYDPNVLPPFLTPSNNVFWIDMNGNGLADIFDPAQGGTAAPTPNSNGGDLDWRDNTTTVTVPIQLISFTIVENDCINEISWITENETEVDKIVLEKCIDGRVFNFLAEFDGINKAFNEYTFIEDAEDKSAYYRLKIIDYNRSEILSEILHIKSGCHDKSVEMNIFPNPIAEENELNLYFEGFIGAVAISVLDGSGKLIKSLVQNSNGRANYMKMELDGLSRGIYFIHVSDGQDYLTQSLVVD